MLQCCFSSVTLAFAQICQAYPTKLPQPPTVLS